MTFHFDYKTISKSVPLKYGGQLIHPSFDAPASPAREHAGYIERDGAVELGRRISASELAELDAQVERQSDTKGNVWIRSVFSNISEDPEERLHYWRLIEALEQPPTLYNIYFNPDCSPAWWVALEKRTGFEPAVFRDHALQELAAYRRHVSTRPSSEKFRSKPLQLTRTEDDHSNATKRRLAADKPSVQAALWSAVNRLPDYDDDNPPIRVEADRAGRIQIRIIGELPHELSAQDRAEIVERFGSHVANLETRTLKTGGIAQVGLMFTSAVHAPDAHNDPRNYHFHMVAHDRPARQDDFGDWDFADAEYKIDSYGRASTTYPQREKKIACVSQGRKVSGVADAGNEFIKSLRRTFAQITNDVLKKRGKRKRYDPRRYDEMDIDRTVTRHLGTAAASLAAVGVRTSVADRNAAILWNDDRRRLDHEDKERRSELSDWKFLSASIWARDFPADHEHVMRMTHLRDERSELLERYATNMFGLDLLKQCEAKARSTAERVKRTCDRYLYAFHEGNADRQIIRNVERVRQRKEEAEEHLKAIADALARHRAALASLNTSLNEWISQIHYIDREWKQLEPLMREEWERMKECGQQSSPKAQGLQKVPSESRVVDPAGEHSNLNKPALISPSLPLGTVASEVAQAVDHSCSAEPSNDIEPDSSSPPENEQREPGSTLPTVAEADDRSEPGSCKNEPAQTPEPKSSVGPPARSEAPQPEAAPASLEPPMQPDELREVVEVTLQPAPSSRPAPSAPIFPEDEGLQVARVAVPRSAAASARLPTNPLIAEPNPSEAAERVQEDEPAGKGLAAFVISSERPKAEVGASAGDEKSTSNYPRSDAGKDGKAVSPKPECAVETVPGPTPKAINSPSANERWADLLRKINERKIRLFKVKQTGGKERFDAPSLSDVDRRFLASLPLQKVASVLDRLRKEQQLEIDQAVRWIQRVGVSCERLIFEDGRTIADTRKDAIRRVFDAWINEPELVEALAAERSRRATIDEEFAAAEGRLGLPPSKCLAERQREMKKALPGELQLSRPEVIVFVRLLRFGALRDELEKAAEQVDENPLARAEVLASTLALRQFFKQYEPGPSLTVQAAARSPGMNKG